MNKEKKVLHLRSSGGMLGAENVIAELCRYSQEFGYASHVAAFGTPDSPEPDFLNYIPGSSSKTVFHCNGKFDLKLMKTIQSYVEQHQIDLLHCHGYKENFYAQFSRTNVSKVATNHLWKKPDFKGRVYAHLDAFVLKFFDAVVAVSDEIEQDMRKKGICKHTLKINNGIDVSKFLTPVDVSFLKKQLDLPEDAVVLGMISSLTHEKGHLVALEAIKDIVKKEPQVHLVIVGDGPEENKIQSFVRQTKMEKNIILAGRQSNIPEYLSLFDIFMIPSYKEGLPMALLEAMASSKAIIASAVGEIPNVITDRKNGLLVKPGDPESIVKALNYLLQEKQLIIQMGQHALKTVRSQYDARIMAKTYCQLYDQVLEKKIKYHTP